MIRTIARTLGFTMVLAMTLAASTALATQPYSQTAPGYAQASPQGTAPGQPVDVTGTVAQFDRQNGVITFQDGRGVQLNSQSAVYQAAPGASTQSGNPSAWQPVLAASIQPGSQIYVHNAHILSMAPAQPNVAGAHVGVVKYVDPPDGLIALTDGSYVKVLPSTQVQS